MANLSSRHAPFLRDCVLAIPNVRLVPNVNVFQAVFKLQQSSRPITVSESPLLLLRLIKNLKYVKKLRAPVCARPLLCESTSRFTTLIINKDQKKSLRRADVYITFKV